MYLLLMYLLYLLYVLVVSVTFNNIKNDYFTIRDNPPLEDIYIFFRGNKMFIHIEILYSKRHSVMSKHTNVYFYNLWRIYGEEVYRGSGPPGFRV